MILVNEANKESFNGTVIKANSIVNNDGGANGVDTKEADKLKAKLIALDLQNQEDIVAVLARTYIIDMFKENSDDFS